MSRSAPATGKTAYVAARREKMAAGGAYAKCTDTREQIECECLTFDIRRVKIAVLSWKKISRGIQSVCAGPYAQLSVSLS